jgi:hypothetical protein
VRKYTPLFGPGHTHHRLSQHSRSTAARLRRKGRSHWSSSTGAGESVQAATMIACGLGEKDTRAAFVRIIRTVPYSLKISFNRASESRVEGLRANGWAGNSKGFFRSC